MYSTPQINFNEISTSTDIQHLIDQYQISQNYFSSVIGVQTAIFSLIVAVIVALYFFFNWKTSKNYIKEQMDVYVNTIKESSEKEFAEKMENLQNIFNSGMSRHEKEIGGLTGSNYRTLGQFWEREKEYGTAFIWWFRAAHQFSKISEEKLTRICLSSAKNSLERVQFGSDLDTDTIGEYQKILIEIPDSYTIEKNLIDQAIKVVLTKKP